MSMYSLGKYGPSLSKGWNRRLKWWLAPFVGSASIGSPAVSNDGWDWISTFMCKSFERKLQFIILLATPPP
jgi:hypothetical protein